MTDEEIDTSDCPPLTEEFFKKAKLRLPASTQVVEVEVDKNTLDWYRAQGEEYAQKMTAALRIYAEAHKMSAKKHQAV
jgi:uncharacterized protein (DUF4415 family)